MTVFDGPPVLTHSSFQPRKNPEHIHIVGIHLVGAPSIRERFGTPETFMAMVRTGYPVVYRPQSVQFEAPAVVDGEVIQPVRMTDADGQAWIAFYPMQRQADGAWRINGCQLERLRGQRT